MPGDLTGADPDVIGDDLLVLFARGERPTMRQVRDHAEIAEFVDGHGPDLVHYEHKVDIAPPDGLALQRAGLVFDLVGLAPGPPIPVPDLGGVTMLDEAVLQVGTDASSLRLGPHIAAGRSNLTILREWFGLAAAIATRFDADRICWVPAGKVVPIDALLGHLDAWDSRGEVPVGLLANFRRTLDGALQSHGLSYFTGQEFRLELRAIHEQDDPLARLIFAHLFYDGTQTVTGELAAPDGHSLALEPSANGSMVRVWRV